MEFTYSAIRNSDGARINITIVISGPTGAANETPSATITNIVTLTQPELLADQQSTYTPLIINQHSYSLVDGVGSNLDGQFGGNGVSPFVSPNGFAMSTTGMANWMAQREAVLRSARDRKAFDLFASELERRAKAAELAAATLDAPGRDNANEIGAGEAQRPEQAGALASNKASGEGPHHLSAYQSDAAVEAGAMEYRSTHAADVAVEDFVDIAAAPPSWNAWVKGSWTLYDGDGASFDGHVANIMGGIDYRLREDLIIGLLAGYGVAEFDTVTGGTAGSFDADGYTVGAYFGHKITSTLTLDGLVAYTGSDYDNRVGATTGSFDAHRITAAGHLKGRFEMGVATIEPTLGVMWASERQDAYTDSAAVAHAARTVTAGRLSLGPRISFAPISAGNGEAFFWFATKGEYDFSNQGNSATTGLPDIDDVFSGRFQAGINATADNGVRLSLQGDVSGLGSGEFIAYGGTVKLIVPIN